MPDRTSLRRETFRSDRGSVTYALLGTRTLWFEAEGYFDKSLIAHYAGALTRAMPYGPVEVFLDWQAMTGYDSECRKQLTDLVLNNRERFAKVHVLVRHKLVAMGVTTASMLIGGAILVAHTERSQFEQLLNQALASLDVRRGQTS
jgi:hypothetical protein